MLWICQQAYDILALHGKPFLHWFILGYELSYARIINNHMLKTNICRGSSDEEMVELLRCRKWINFPQKNLTAILMTDISSHFCAFLKQVDFKR